MSPVQYAEWESLRTALNVLTTELIEIRRKGESCQSPFANFKIFVLRIPYGFEQDVARVINQRALEQLPSVFSTEQVPKDFMLAYSPMHIRKQKEAKSTDRVGQLASLMPNTLFLFAEEPSAQKLVEIGLGKKRQKGEKVEISLMRLRLRRI